MDGRIYCIQAGQVVSENLSLLLLFDILPQTLEDVSNSDVVNLEDGFSAER